MCLVTREPMCHRNAACLSSWIACLTTFVDLNEQALVCPSSVGHCTAGGWPRHCRPSCLEPPLQGLSHLCSVCVCACVCVRACVRACACQYACACVSVCVCLSVCPCACVSVCIALSVTLKHSHSPQWRWLAAVGFFFFLVFFFFGFFLCMWWCHLFCSNCWLESKGSHDEAKKTNKWRCEWWTACACRSRRPSCSPRSRSGHLCEFHHCVCVCVCV